ncbi:Cu-oxidase-domain-containing protein [Rhizoclosmatium globosum]|uniref:Cu-oxidase-domain-containing protein n=1 Tax=Rhizoclosmatium globosum TaxID=329046 RepID=A0A1Y2B1N7_9FUNG|nr:Cu-oxidase-domain-containing protein [Rhizoclosmatium globosum]|eukprot:ORY28722.1 Cu-oxidase-domain-containing protein [Rhizoclosmatium globosum]
MPPYQRFFVGPDSTLSNHRHMIPIVFSFLISLVAAATKQFTMDLSYATVSPDGVPVQMMTVNGQYDYTITVDTGDHVSIIVNNNLNEETSMHWHGLDMRGVPWMDGAGMVTQCPIPPGGSFTYEFNVGDQTGTYWYHAHSHFQETNGIRGPFIIRDPKEPFRSQYDQEFIMTLADHFHVDAKIIFAHYDNPAPSSGLINGLGRVNCDAAKESFCVVDNPLTVFTVEKGKKYRFRVINTSAQAGYRVSIDGHEMTIVEADGYYTNPTVVDSFDITPGQRYSFLIEAKATIQNYWIRAIMEDMYTPAGTTITNGLNLEANAILRYNGAPTTATTSTISPAPTPKSVLDVYTLGELNGMTPATKPTKVRDMILHFLVAGNPANASETIATFTLDSKEQSFVEKQYKLPSTPTLKDLLGTGVDGSQGRVNSVVVEDGEWVNILLVNDDNVDHTFHLHGHAFYVTSAGNMLHKKRRQESTLTTYPRRDSIQVPACSGGIEGSCFQGFVNLLVKFDNPGAWLFHCHIDWHMGTGLSLTFINKNVDKLKDKIPKDFWKSC